LRDADIGTLQLGGLARVRLVDCTVEHIEGGARLPCERTPAVRADGCRLGTITVPGRIRLRHTTVLSAMDVRGLSAGNSLLESVKATESARLQRCAVRSLTAGGDVRAIRTLLGALDSGGEAWLEYATVLGAATAHALKASDALLAGPLTAPGGSARYSRLPAGASALSTYAVTSATPRFRTAAWGEPGCGVLAAGAPAAIRLGAEDGGELGAHHDAAAGLEDLALRDQLADHLPHGLEPVLVPDIRLHVPPPTLIPEDR